METDTIKSIDKWIDSGVTAPLGFRAAGMHVGVKSRDPNKLDTAIIAAEALCNAAAVYTKNVVKAAPIHITKKHLENGKAQAVIVNSGNANACAPEGEENAELMCAAVAETLGLKASDIIVASTGVIGQRLPVEKIVNAVPQITSKLSAAVSGSEEAAKAIMTTDTVKKEYAIETTLSGRKVKIGGISKGSGMIHPNMGTMLAFITTDAAISSEMLHESLLTVTGKSFNRISVDGDTSTNDMACVLASGIAGNAEITAKCEDYTVFTEALAALCIRLARDMASDGEGAKHLITCTVSGAENENKAEHLSKSVISSTLFKAAVFGTDANWGRVLCAMGYSGAEFNQNSVDVEFRSAAGSVAVCKNGRGLEFDEALAKRILSEHDIEVLISLNEAPRDSGSATCWGCDITYDYIKINGDYRT